MALEFRMRFKRDVFIDLLGYRKYGHNEGDEPRFTQPKLYKAIAKQKTPRDIYAQQLMDEGVIDENYKKKIIADFKAMLETQHKKSKEDIVSKVIPFMESTWESFERHGVDSMLAKDDTTYTVKNLKEIAKVISTVPEGVKF